MSVMARTFDRWQAKYAMNARGSPAARVADELAEAGYIAIAPDLLLGMGPNGSGTSSFADGNAVGNAIRDLPPDQITADLNAVADSVARLAAAKEATISPGQK